MKTRQGFVSNSSSSSFVVLLPDTLKFEDINQENIKNSILEYLGFEDEKEDPDEYNSALNDVKKAFSKLKDGSEVWTGEDAGGRVLEELFYKSDDSRDTDLEGPLAKYVIASFDTSSDAGQIIGVKRADVEKILSETA